ncbi:MAG: MBL fold metallo-hydrolase [Gemmataceae bacterium]
MSERSLTILGCGTSVGVPMIGCHCAVCRSTNPKNHRFRSSILFRFPQGNVLVDTTPEMRLQLLREKIDLVHAVLYTHFHADHLFGLDDVRLFPRHLGGPLPIYCSPDTESVIRQSFSYAFTERAAAAPAGFIPQLVFRTIDSHPFTVLGEKIVPIPLRHSRFDVFGFRVGDVAYCTDVNEVPESSMARLEGLDVLILDALRPGPQHPSHFCLPESLAVIEQLKPKRAYLTHMAHEMDYDHPPTLPGNVELAYDGLSFTF